MKFNLKKLEKTALIGVASLALIIPLAGNGASVQASSHHSLRYYEKCLDDDDTLDYSNFDNNSDDDLPTVRMKMIMKYPALKHTTSARDFLEEIDSWEYDDWSFYAHHYKQIYSPYLRKAMPSHEQDAYVNLSYAPRAYKSAFRHNNYLIYKARKQLGLLGHHRNRRHVRHHARHQSHKRIRRINRHHRRIRRRNHRSRRSNRR